MFEQAIEKTHEIIDASQRIRKDAEDYIERKLDNARANNRHAYSNDIIKGTHEAQDASDAVELFTDLCRDLKSLKAMAEKKPEKIVENVKLMHDLSGRHHSTIARMNDEHFRMDVAEDLHTVIGLILEEIPTHQS